MGDVGRVAVELEEPAVVVLHPVEVDGVVMAADGQPAAIRGVLEVTDPLLGMSKDFDLLELSIEDPDGAVLAAQGDVGAIRTYIQAPALDTVLEVPGLLIPRDGLACPVCLGGDHPDHFATGVAPES